MNKNNYIIRLETEKDYRETENLAREAFYNIYVTGCSEHYLIHTMRNHKDFIPELDYVIELDGKIIGSVMYTKGKLIDEKGEEREIISFGPLCVHPDYQRMGYGKALLHYTFEKAIGLGYDAIIIFGNPGNYVARGFKSCHKYNIVLENDVCPMAMMLKELIPDTFDGRRWIFKGSDFDAVCDDEKAVEEFDRTFPPKEKMWMPSQEEFYIHCHSAITR
jgi:predicted N-acetyltransferase YhbS